MPHYTTVVMALAGLGFALFLGGQPVVGVGLILLAKAIWWIGFAGWLWRG